MRQLRRRATWTGAILGTLAALFVLAMQAHASAQGSETEEFHQTYPLAVGQYCGATLRWADEDVCPHVNLNGSRDKAGERFIGFAHKSACATSCQAS